MISVAMATYNGELYLRQQIESILNQTYKDIELIVCDDCSADETVRILDEYATHDARVKVYKNQANMGFRRNFERAISLCTGEFIALCDQDDIWEIWKLERELREIDGYDIVCTNSRIVDEYGNDSGYTMKDSLGCKFIPDDDPLLMFKHLLHQNFVQGSTLLGNAEFLKSCLPIPDGFEYHDWWFAFRACKQRGIRYLDTCSIRYRKHRTQVTTNENNKFFEEIARSFKRRDERWFNDFYQNNLKKIRFAKSVLSAPGLNLNATELNFVNETITYFEHMQNRDWYTFTYFIKNYEAIFLDRNRAKKAFRIAKRLMGGGRWQITSSRKARKFLLSHETEL